MPSPNGFLTAPPPPPPPQPKWLNITPPPPPPPAAYHTCTDGHSHSPPGSPVMANFPVRRILLAISSIPSIQNSRGSLYTSVITVSEMGSSPEKKKEKRSPPQMQLKPVPRVLGTRKRSAHQGRFELPTCVLGLHGKGVSFFWVWLT